MTDLQFDDKLRYAKKTFIENLLSTGCGVQGKKLRLSRSKYIRYAIINQLIRDKYPLSEFTDKFDPFYKVLKNKEKNRAMTACK